MDSDWLIGRTSSRIGIVPITYLKDTNTTQILFCGEDFYENITELKQKEQIWILQEKNSQLQAQVVLLICSGIRGPSAVSVSSTDSGPIRSKVFFSENSVSLTFLAWSVPESGLGLGTQTTDGHYGPSFRYYLCLVVSNGR